LFQFGDGRHLVREGLVVPEQIAEADLVGCHDKALFSVSGAWGTSGEVPGAPTGSSYWI
jgi:hypothetical protein